MSVTILGGGISGLSAAFYLSLIQRGLKLKLYESSARFGGWMQTDVNRKEGYIFEAGPRTLRPKGLAGNTTLELIELLDLKKNIIPIRSNHVAAKNRMIYAKNELCLLPSDIRGVLNTVPPFTKPLYKAGLKDWFGKKSKTPLHDESIYDFAARRFGKEIADYAVSSMICGICAGDAKEISVKFLMKRLFEKEQKFGGVIKGLLFDFLVNGDNRIKEPAFNPCDLMKKAKHERWSIYSLTGGLETLPKAIVKNLSENEAVSMNLNSNCERIKFEPGGSAQVTVNGIVYTTKHIVSALPSFNLGQLLEHQHPKLAKELKMIKTVDVAVINLHYNEDLLEYEGFGLLVPPIENLPILGIIFDSCCFKMEGQTVLTVMLGGKWFEKWFGVNPSGQKLLEVALDNVNRILKIDEKPDHYKVRILRNCIPQYVVGHHDRVDRIRAYVRDHKLPLTLCGSSYDGVGVNDVILSARYAVDRIVVQ